MIGGGRGGARGGGMAAVALAGGVVVGGGLVIALTRARRILDRILLRLPPLARTRIRIRRLLAPHLSIRSAPVARSI